MKRYTVRVDVKTGLGDECARIRGGNVWALLDMFRYAGLLQSNVWGFPDVIEYEVEHPPTEEIERWKSFGFSAEEVR